MSEVVVYIFTTVKERNITTRQRTEQFYQHVLHIHGPSANKWRRNVEQQAGLPATTLVLRKRRQAGLAARMGELKNETLSTSKVNMFGGLDRVRKRYRNFVGGKCISVLVSARQMWWHQTREYATFVRRCWTPNVEMRSATCTCALHHGRRNVASSVDKVMT